MERTKQLQMFSAVIYNTNELAGRLETAFRWTVRVDDRARKALLYGEHGFLLSEFAQTLPLMSAHASFSWGMAFLQLFKALTTILGEPGTDKDYQRRATRLGLPSDFWSTRVKELYSVRNDDDVAHYSLELPDDRGVMVGRFGQPASIFKDALAAYISTLPDPTVDGDDEQGI